MNIINIKNLSKTYDYYKKEPGLLDKRAKPSKLFEIRIPPDRLTNIRYDKRKKLPCLEEDEGDYG